MDILGVHQMKRNKHVKRKKEAVKVVYISSPMKVKTSASKFRSLVQELTGRDSDVARFMETNGGDDRPTVSDGGSNKSTVNDHVYGAPMVDIYRESPTSSDSLFEPFDDVFASYMKESTFAGMFPSSFLYESAQVDALRSLDAV